MRKKDKKKRYSHIITTMNHSLKLGWLLASEICVYLINNKREKYQ